MIYLLINYKKRCAQSSLSLLEETREEAGRQKLENVPVSPQGALAARTAGSCRPGNGEVGGRGLRKREVQEAGSPATCTRAASAAGGLSSGTLMLCSS